ncbi:MAG TPA: DNA-directed DNA polymerase II small subunit [Methanothrix sp.]|nr:DNA-directed DNA polymerase II small subunit [Methanothrix sp.]HPT18670.1 DNA-directed DNA polymerase II small subunit [Methanothrix sp.]
MQRISPHLNREGNHRANHKGGRDGGREIVIKFAENGYQLEPEALEAICRYSGSKEELVSRIMASIDRSVAVIETAQISCHLIPGRPAPALSRRPQPLRADPPRIAPASLPDPACLPDSSAELLCDITGRSTCVGEYDDFVHYFRDRYARIRDILSRRLNSRPIESLGKSCTGREVSLIGMVMEVRSTAKGNRVIELEDPTGMVTAIITRDSEIYEQSAQIITDEVIGVTGTSDGNGRLFVKSLLWPDMPAETAPLAKGSGHALLLSDLHVGSKYFMAEAWDRFLLWLNGETDDPSGLAARVQYMLIAGDLVDGVGIYPGQQNDLAVMDIYDQYEAAAEKLNSIREGVKVIIAPGNHDIVRQAEPQPCLPEEVKKYFRKDMLFVGNPAWVNIGGVSVLIYHGRSIDDLVLRLPGVSYAAPEKAMIEMLKRRHLSPIYGSRVSIAPEHEDHYVISRPPAILHCGHVHTVGIARYKGVAVINSGTWQSQTDFQKKMNIQPVAAVAPLVDLATMKVRKLIFA